MPEIQEMQTYSLEQGFSNFFTQGTLNLIILAHGTFQVED